MVERDRDDFPSLSTTIPSSAAPTGLTADPRYRLTISEPPHEKSLPIPRVLLVSIAGLTGGLAILFSALKKTGLIG